MQRAPIKTAPHFPLLDFRGQLRPSQVEVVEIARRKLAAGAKRMHIVAPPGSGKTILGLFLWSQCVRTPALVLSPNSAIQMQWAAKTELFTSEGQKLPEEWISSDPLAPALLTSLTYQSLTIPGRGSDELDGQARELWHAKLVENGHAKDLPEAAAWLADMQQRNPNYFDQRLAAYRKQVRDAMALGGDALKTLHSSALATLERLRTRGIGLVIVDECHHLLGHWGRVLADASDLLAGPIIIGLTATPPDCDGKLPQDVARYEEFLGPVDFEVPVPAVVKDGFLAPYQDLAYFVRPTAEELSFIANADAELHNLVEELCNAAAFGPPPPVAPPNSPRAAPATRRESPAAEQPVRESLPTWVTRVLTEKRLPTGVVKDWPAFQRRDPDFSLSARQFLLHRQLPLPEEIPPPDSLEGGPDVPELEFLVPVLDRYVRHRLRHSSDERDQQLAEQTIARLRMLGIQITETGCQACASPVGRVIAYSRAKCAALVPILTAERRILGDKLRAVVVADYEKSSAVAASVAGLLDEEAGGATAAFKSLISDPETDFLNPVLVTGSSVLIDDDLEAEFLAAAREWLKRGGYEVALSIDTGAAAIPAGSPLPPRGFHVLQGEGSDWSPRVYVEMITELFQRGVTKCLVGTRGLLGEGWDANKINVLVDLTTVTTRMTVNQLRGRSIRLDPDEPIKVANNWDVVCIAPEFAKGLDDYGRFRAKHQTLYGVTDDGVVEKGVGHVHPAFTRLRPEGLEGNVAALNDDMLARADRRGEARKLWNIGQPYRNQPVRALEARPLRDRDVGTFPPFTAAKQPWSSRSLALKIGEAVLGALVEAGLVARHSPIQVGERAGGYVRIFLEQAGEEDCQLFTRSLYEALGPIQQPRYVIPRQVDRLEDTWLSALLPKIVGQYFQQRRRGQAMLHAVPLALAKNKELVEIFERHWNRCVSPGQAIYAQRGAADETIDQARQRGQLPTGWVQEKDVFL